jgi:hypothetical protein
MDRIDSFNEGDIVAFKVDIDNLSDSSIDCRYCVIGKDNGNVKISKRGSIEVVSPLELLTSEEIEKAQKEASEALNKIIFG